MQMPVVRRVNGDSMSPLLRDGQIVIGLRNKTICKGNVVMFSKHGIEMIKRIQGITADGIDVRGDNVTYSTDSRHFGPIQKTDILAVIVWPRI